LNAAKSSKLNKSVDDMSWSTWFIFIVVDCKPWCCKTAACSCASNSAMDGEFWTPTGRNCRDVSISSKKFSAMVIPSVAYMVAEKEGRKEGS
jgi:hypothetical protein